MFRLFETALQLWCGSWVYIKIQGCLFWMFFSLFYIIFTCILDYVSIYKPELWQYVVVAYVAFQRRIFCTEPVTRRGLHLDSSRCDSTDNT